MKEGPKYYIDRAGLYYKTVGGATYWLDEETKAWTFFCKADELEVLATVTALTEEQEIKLTTNRR